MEQKFDRFATRLHDIPQGPNQSQKTYATGPAKMSESMTSSTPPKPGTADASLRSQSRLIIDSIRSPSWATTRSPAVERRPRASRGSEREAKPGDRRDQERGRHAEDQAADGPLDRLLRAQRRPELVAAGEPAHRVGAGVGSLGRRDQEDQGHNPLGPSNQRI